MQPRVLAINFVHGLSEPEARRQLETLSARAARVLALAGVSRPRCAGLPRLSRDRHRGPVRAARAHRSQLGPLPARRRRGRPRLRRALRIAAARRPAAGGAGRARAGPRGLAARRPHRPHGAVGDRRGQTDLRRRLPSAGVRGAGGELGRTQRAVDRSQPAASCSSTSPAASAARWRASGTRWSGWRRAARFPTTSATSASTRCSTSTGASGCPSTRSTARAAPRRLPDAHVAALPPRLAASDGRGLRARGRERALHAQRTLRLRPRRRPGGAVHDREAGGSRARRRSRGGPTCSSVTASWRRTAWAAGSSTGARTCRGWTIGRSTTTAAR